MPVSGRHRQIGLQRDGSDPDVVLRDGSARLSQLRGDATVKLGRGFIGQQHVHGYPFFSLSASRYFSDKETLCLYWPLGTAQMGLGDLCAANSQLARRKFGA
jgi:hypothetical protein